MRGVLNLVAVVFVKWNKHEKNWLHSYLAFLWGKKIQWTEFVTTLYFSLTNLSSQLQWSWSNFTPFFCLTQPVLNVMHHWLLFCPDSKGWTGHDWLLLLRLTECHWIWYFSSLISKARCGSILFWVSTNCHFHSSTNKHRWQQIRLFLAIWQ